MRDLKVNLLDHGFVRRIDSMGNDLSIVRAARVSYDAAWRTGENEANDSRLMRRLWTGGKKKNIFELPRHSSPFEAVTVTFEVMAPIFVFRQWHRHRTQAYNELSARYRELPEVFYLPTEEVVGVQDEKEKQARGFGATAPGRVSEIELVRIHCEAAFSIYRTLLNNGWPRELARIVLPFSTYSHMFATASLLNWLRFMSLRSEAHAQYEIRVYSDAIAELLSEVVPEVIELWREGVAGLEATLAG